MFGTDSPHGLWFGGDYNPEQWSEAIWDDDVKLMKRAKVGIVTLAAFSWWRLEPTPGRFDFEWLDRVIEKLHRAGIRVDLATATASPPAWLSLKHPQVLPLTIDGLRLHHGSRQAYCPSSADYREAVARLVRAMVERYGDHPAVVWWHINNEYACHVSRCYCDESAEAFRRWLRLRYDNSIDQLNRSWNTSFWSQGYAGFDEVGVPRATPTFANPTQLLDFDRFSSDELLDCLRIEKAIIRSGSNRPVTTNFMGLFRPLDYWKWAEEVDFISNDSYPDPSDPAGAASTALSSDLMRSLKSGQSWAVMEQATAAVQWRPRNVPKPPGGARAQSMQAIGRGADAIMFFQWRQSAAGAEKFHAAMLPHSGPETRIFREVCELGKQLEGFGEIRDQPVNADTAIVLDWDSWWAIEQPAQPVETDYAQTIARWHGELWRRNILVDFVAPLADLDRYKLVVVPQLYVLPQGAAEWIEHYLRRGGTLVVSNRTGILDDELHIFDEGYLGPLQSVLGVRPVEFWPLAAETDTVPIGQQLGHALGWTEELQILEPAAGEVDTVAVYGSGFLTGMPAVTRRVSGGGAAWYLGAELSIEGLGNLISRLVSETGIAPVAEVPLGVEAMRRGTHLLLVNHGSSAVAFHVDGRDIELGALEVAILRALRGASAGTGQSKCPAGGQGDLENGSRLTTGENPLGTPGHKGRHS